MRGCDGGTAITTNNLEDFQTELGGQFIGRRANELPDLVDHNSLFLGPVGLDVVPDIIQGNHHTDREQLAFQFGEVQNDVLIGQIHIRLAVEALGRTGHKTADDGGNTHCHGIFQQVLMKITKNGHFLQLRWEARRISIQRVVIVGDAKRVVGFDQRLIQHLLLLIGHVRNQQGEEDHELLNLSGQHGVHIVVVNLVNQLHLRGNRVPDLHDIDAVGRTGGNLDKLAADFAAGPFEFMTLDGGDNIALNTAHSHTQSQKLKREGLAGAAGAAHGQVRVLVDLRIKKVNNAERIVMPVDAQKYTGIVRHLEAGEHIGGRCTAGQDISLGFLLQLGTDLEERHDAAQGILLLEAAIAEVHIHGLEHIDHLLLAPQKLIVGLCGNGHEYRHIEQILVVVGNAIFDVIARLNGVGQFFVIGTGVLHTLELGAVQSDTLGDLVNGFAPVLPGEVDINIDALTGIDKAGHPTTPHGTGIPVPLDVEEAVIPAIHDDVVVMG